MYSPTLGRWMQPDPAGYVDGMSLYVAEGSNPVTRLDPLGRETLTPTTQPLKPATTQAAQPCKMTQETEALVKALADKGVLNALCKAWKDTNPAVQVTDIMDENRCNAEIRKARAEHGGFILPDGKGGYVIQWADPGPAGEATIVLAPDLKIRDRLIGDFHAHPDLYNDPPDVEKHNPKTTSIFDPIEGIDLSNYLPPSLEDFRAAHFTSHRPGIVIDRFYMYVYQEDGCVWAFAHPCKIVADPHIRPDPVNPDGTRVFNPKGYTTGPSANPGR